MLVTELAYGLLSLIRSNGGLITYTNVTTIDNAANPAPNPPTMMGLVVADNALEGAVTINFSADVLTGRLIAGDTFQVPGDPTIYTVGSQVISPLTAQTLTGVPFTPGLAEPVSADAVPTFTFAATFTVRASITGFPAILINGTSIQQHDKRIRMLIDGVLPGEVPNSFPAGVTANIGDLVTLSDGAIYKVIRKDHPEMQGINYGWSLQLRQ